jgi:hypothetical protein
MNALKKAGQLLFAVCLWIGTPAVIYFVGWVAGAFWFASCLVVMLGGGYLVIRKKGFSAAVEEEFASRAAEMKK